MKTMTMIITMTMNIIMAMIITMNTNNKIMTIIIKNIHKIKTQHNQTIYKIKIKIKFK